MYGLRPPSLHHQKFSLFFPLFGLNFRCPALSYPSPLRSLAHSLILSPPPSPYSCLLLPASQACYPPAHLNDTPDVRKERCHGRADKQNGGGHQPMVPSTSCVVARRRSSGHSLPGALVRGGLDRARRSPTANRRTHTIVVRAGWV